MLSSQLDYHLPPRLIATQPANPRDAAKFMLVRRESGSVEHHRVGDLVRLPGLLGPGDLLVFNQTRVVPAYFTGLRRGTGGHIKGLFLNAPASRQWHVMLEARGSLRAGEAIDLGNSAWLELAEPMHQGEWLATLHGPDDTLVVLARIGATPLPPYIRRRRRALHQPEVGPDDAAWYNTVYATDPGSVAAPTAGLHFTNALLAALDALGVQRCHLTLHVGLGTFAPIRSATLEEHNMHAEWFTVPGATIAALRNTRAAGGRIIPIGTTTVRALESLPDPLPPAGPFSAETRLLIAPGFPFRFTDGLMTNFHLPRSTLLALVAALPGVGIERLLSWYQVAIGHDYRFYSYGDAMLIL